MPKNARKNRFFNEYYSDFKTKELPFDHFYQNYEYFEKLSPITPLYLCRVVPHLERRERRSLGIWKTNGLGVYNLNLKLIGSYRKIFNFPKTFMITKIASSSRDH